MLNRAANAAVKRRKSLPRLQEGRRQRKVDAIRQLTSLLSLWLAGGMHAKCSCMFPADFQADTRRAGAPLVRVNRCRPVSLPIDPADSERLVSTCVLEHQTERERFLNIFVLPLTSASSSSSSWRRRERVARAAIIANPRNPVVLPKPSSFLQLLIAVAEEEEVAKGREDI